MDRIVEFLEFFAGLLIWVVFALVRFVLVLAGIVFFVPFGLLVAAINKQFFTKGRYSTLPLFSFFGAAENITRFDPYEKNLGELYWEMAVRNPVKGLDGRLKQPVPEEKPNPDEKVRGGQVKKAVRFMQAGFYWEYWTLSVIDEDHWAGKIKSWRGRYWEFRIGWKFVDGNDDFVPTFQIGPKR